MFKKGNVDDKKFDALHSNELKSLISLFYFSVFQFFFSILFSHKIVWLQFCAVLLNQNSVLSKPLKYFKQIE